MLKKVIFNPEVDIEFCKLNVKLAKILPYRAVSGNS